MSNKTKRLLWQKKQAKVMASEERKQKSRTLDMAFIKKQVGLTPDKANKKLKELHLMKKSNYIFSLKLASRYDKECKIAIIENLNNASDSRYIMASDKANETFSALLERQERLLEAVKAFGMEPQTWKELQELISRNTANNNSFENVDIAKKSDYEILQAVKAIIEQSQK